MYHMILAAYLAHNINNPYKKLEDPKLLKHEWSFLPFLPATTTCEQSWFTDRQLSDPSSTEQYIVLLSPLEAGDTKQHEKMHMYYTSVVKYYIMWMPGWCYF